jgi:hypothetical protein
MEFYQREYFLAKIHLDYTPITFNETKYKILKPTPQITFEACEKYNEIIELDSINEDDILGLMYEKGLWDAKREKEFSEIFPKHLEYWKIQLFKSYTKIGEQDTVRKYLEKVKTEYDECYRSRNEYRMYTKEWVADFIKQLYILEHSVVDQNDNRVEIEPQELYISYLNAIVSNSVIRELARTTPWVHYWNAYKSNGEIFPKPLTLEQVLLIKWSKFYDNIRESPDCPSDDIIQDDDALDGWLILQNKKVEAQRMKSQIEGGLNSKIAGSQDIGIIVKPEDIDKVDLMNDDAGRMIKGQRLRTVREKGVVKEHELVDKKQDIRSQLLGGRKK